MLSLVDPGQRVYEDVFVYPPSVLKRLESVTTGRRSIYVRASLVMMLRILFMSLRDIIWVIQNVSKVHFEKCIHVVTLLTTDGHPIRWER